jgi:hypothetical protein
MLEDYLPCQVFEAESWLTGIWDSGLPIKV